MMSSSVSSPVVVDKEKFPMGVKVTEIEVVSSSGSMAWTLISTWNLSEELSFAGKLNEYDFPGLTEE